MDIAERLEAIGSVDERRVEELLERENVGRIVADEIEEKSSARICGETVVGAVETVDIERHQLHDVGIGAIVLRGRNGRAAQLEEERYERVPEQDCSQREEEVPTAEAEP